MDSFPDEVLVTVFGFVGTRLLLTEVRAVCRRWRLLALHRDAWAHRGSYTRRPREMLRVLEVAPCFKFFSCDVGRESRDEPVGPQLLWRAASTDCAVRRLALTVGSEPGGVSAAMEVLSNQLRLGRLRSLYVETQFLPPWDLRRVLRVVGDLRLDFLGLDLCQVPSRAYDPLQVLPDALWGSGSAKCLHYFCHERLHCDGMFERILRARSHCQEEMDVHATDDVAVISKPFVSSLSGFPALRKLRVPALVELPALLLCPQLSSLTVSFDSLTDKGPSAQLAAPLRTFFQGATFLRELHLELGFPNSPVLCEFILEMALALSCSGRSVLEELTVDSVLCLDDDDDEEDAHDSSGNYQSEVSPLTVLPVLLRGLPRLRRLHLGNVPPVHALDCVSLESAPSLRRLELDLRHRRLEPDLEPRLLDALSRLVARLPDLHATIKCESWGRSCKQCLPHLGPQCALGLYAHPSATVCKQHDAHLEWRRVVTPP